MGPVGTIPSSTRQERSRNSAAGRKEDTYASIWNYGSNYLRITRCDCTRRYRLSQKAEDSLVLVKWVAELLTCLP
jgi:hypothetical protein